VGIARLKWATCAKKNRKIEERPFPAPIKESSLRKRGGRGSGALRENHPKLKTFKPIRDDRGKRKRRREDPKPHGKARRRLKKAAREKEKKKDSVHRNPEAKRASGIHYLIPPKKIRGRRGERSEVEMGNI